MRKKISRAGCFPVVIPDQNLKIVLKLMRIATIVCYFIAAIALQANAKGYAQNVTLQVKNTSLKNVFMLIKKQTGYSFLWKEEVLDKAPKVSADLHSVSVSEALNACLAGTALSYNIEDKIIYISGNTAPVAIVKEIAGVVQSAKDGKPVAAANILIKGNGKGTTADAEGKFSLKVSEGDVLEISSVGYVTASITVRSENFYRIKLEENSKSIDSVVVTAFGIKTRQRAVAFSVATINNAQLTNAGTDNVSTALAGKLPGVDIVAMGAGPMGGTRINLRGLNSLNGNSRPLIILNGIPILDNDVAFSGRGFGNNLRSTTGPQAGSTLDDINPNDIESITTLNGANAAALYGSMGINGAVVIETKSGKEQKGLGVDYSMNFTKNKIYGLPDFQNEYGAGASADRFDGPLKYVPGYDSIPFYAPSGTGVSTSGMAFGPKLNGQDVLWWDGKVRPWVAQPNNYKDFFNDGYSMNHTIGVSGSDDKSSFRLSGSFYDYKGYLPNMKESRYSVFFSGSRKISKIVTAEVFVNYIYNYRQNPPERIDRASYSIYPNNITSLLKDNTINAKGYQWSDSAYKYVGSSALAANIVTPLYWDPVMNRNQDSRNTLVSTATITVHPIAPLSIRMRIGTNRLYEMNELKQAFTAYAAPTAYTTSQGGYTKSLENDYANHADVIVTYNNNFKHQISLNAFVGATVDDFYNENNTVASANGLLYNGMYSTANFKPRITGTTTYTGSNGTGTQSGYRFQGIFGSATVGYKNLLFLTATDRQDWSSFLPAPNNTVNYPSIGGSFILSDAVKMPAFINFGKLKASYGETGVFGTNYSANTNYTFGSFNGAVTSNYSNPTTSYATNLQPQINKSYEFGIETGMWHDRLRANITYYINKTTNTIMAVPVAYSTGAAQTMMNAGSLGNKGLEVQLVGAVVRNKNFQWNMTLNGTTVKRKVLSLAPGLTSLQLANPFSATIKAAPGQSPMDIYMYTLVKDAKTGKDVVDANGMPQFSQTQNRVGNLLPKLYGGYINSFTFKRLTLTALLEYKFGGQVVSYNNVFWEATGLTKNTLYGRDTDHGGVSYYVQNGKNVLLPAGQQAPDGSYVWHDGIVYDGVTSTGTPNTTIVKASTYYQNRYYNFGTQDAVFDNNYIRLREASISYSLPGSIVSKLHMRSLSASLIARNLWFLYKSLPYDNPDNSLGTNDFSTGILYTGYPLMRNFGVSVNVGF